MTFDSKRPLTINIMHDYEDILTYARRLQERVCEAIKHDRFSQVKNPDELPNLMASDELEMNLQNVEVMPQKLNKYRGKLCHSVKNLSLAQLSFDSVNQQSLKLIKR